MPRITFLIGHKGVGRSTLLRRLADHPDLGNGKRIDKGDTRTWKGWLIGRPVDR